MQKEEEKEMQEAKEAVIWAQGTELHKGRGELTWQSINHMIDLFPLVASTTTTTTSTTTATRNTTPTIPRILPTTPTTVTTRLTPPTIPTSHTEVPTAAGPPMGAPMEAPGELR